MDPTPHPRSPSSGPQGALERNAPPYPLAAGTGTLGMANCVPFRGHAGLRLCEEYDQSGADQGTSCPATGSSKFRTVTGSSCPPRFATLLSRSVGLKWMPVIPKTGFEHLGRTLTSPT